MEKTRIEILDGYSGDACLDVPYIFTQKLPGRTTYFGVAKSCFSLFVKALVYSPTLNLSSHQSDGRRLSRAVSNAMGKRTSIVPVSGNDGKKLTAWDLPDSGGTSWHCDVRQQFIQCLDWRGKARISQRVGDRISSTRKSGAERKTRSARGKWG
jgi:hypothetical protein